MKRLLLIAVLVGCKDAKECAALVDAAEQRIKDGMRQADAHGAVLYHYEEIDKDLPRVERAAWPFEPGVTLHVDPKPELTLDEGIDAALAAEACQHLRTKQSSRIRIYLLAGATTPADRFAARVAWIEAAAKQWKVPFEVLLPVKLPKEVTYYNWPPGTPSAVKDFGREILDMPVDENDQRNARLTALQDKIRIASARCPEIRKRTLEYSDNFDSNIRLAMPQGLRDCGCSGVDAPTVIGLYHILEVSSSENAWVRVSANEGAPLKQAATVGELVAGAKTDATSILRVPAASAREVPGLACDKADRRAIVVRGEDSWETERPADYNALLAGFLEQLDGCIENAPLERGVIGELRVHTDSSLLQPGEGEISMNFYGMRETWDLEQCVRNSGRFDLPGQEKGHALLEVYIPGKPKS